MLDEVDFRMKVLKFHKSPFERQIHESVLIQASKTHHLLNSKMEYNRCQIPRLTIKMGEKEIVERKKDLENDIIEEKRKDQELEEKIKHLRKLINKKRAPRRPQQCEPNRKRAKLDPDGLISLEILGLKEKKNQNEMIRQEKRMREYILRRDILTETDRKRQCRMDIRQYFVKSTEETKNIPPQVTISEENISARVPVGGEEGGGGSGLSLPPLLPPDWHYGRNIFF